MTCKGIQNQMCYVCISFTDEQLKSFSYVVTYWPMGKNYFQYILMVLNSIKQTEIDILHGNAL